MRVSTAFTHQLSLNSMLKQYTQLNQTQMKLSTGKSILSPSEDPVASVRILDFKQNIEQTEQYQRNIDIARHRLSSEETVLRSATDLIQRLKELGVQGLNDTNSANERLAIAAEYDQLNDQLLALANTKNANGEYLFAGFASLSEPFSATGAVASPLFEYNGDGNQRYLQIGENRTITDGDPGASVFGPSTPGGADSLFEIVRNFSDELKANDPQAATFAGLDEAMEKILTVRASIGARLNALDRQEEANEDLILNTQTVLSETEDLDYAEAISKFNLQTISLQAAQQTFTKVQNLSLFNYL